MTAPHAMDSAPTPTLDAVIADGGCNVWCDWCETHHHHGLGSGHRAAHCADQRSPYRATGYVIRIVDALLEPAPTARPTTLYRFFDAAGELLYIGISGSAARRFEQHRATKSWWSEVASATLEHHPDRASAEAAERAAIRDESPRHNITHRDRNQPRPVAVPPSHSPVPTKEAQVNPPAKPVGTLSPSHPHKTAGQTGCPTVPPYGVALGGTGATSEEAATTNQEPR